MYKIYTKEWRIYHRHLRRIAFAMRITVFLLLAAFMHVSAGTNAQQITLSEKNAPLKAVLNELRQQSGYDFVYTDKLLQQAIPVTIQVKDAAFQAVLQQLFASQPLDFTVDGKVVVLKERTVRGSTPARPNTILAFPEVRGTVTDSLGQPLAGASIRVLNADGQRTALQTMTDSRGEFTLRNVPDDARLEISYIGYVTLQIPAVTDIGTITMQALPSALEEVEINAGYYTVTDRERTGSISRVTAKEIDNQPVLNPLAAMIGRMPGVSITQSSGIPGSGFAVEIRGRNTLTTASDPLYIVDGVPISGETLGSRRVSSILPISTAVSGVSISGMNPLSSLNPSDIASIEVLKDADATAIYGSRGANGVVLITTKKGTGGKTTYNFRYHRGFGRVARRIELLNTEEYLEMRREAYANDGVTDYPANAYDINGAWDQNRYTDWQKELIGGTATQNNFQGSVSGGSETTSFLLSGGYTKETTVYPGDYANKKIATHATMNHRSGDGRFTANLSVNYGVDQNDFPGRDLSSEAYRLPPNAPSLYDEDGNLNWADGTWNNPLRELEGTYLSTTNNLNSNAVLAYHILPQLEIKTSLGFNDLRMDENRTQPHTYYNPSLGRGPESSYIYLSSSARQSWIVEPQLEFKQSFAQNLELQTLLGTTFQESRNDFLMQQASNFSSNSLIYDIAAAANHYIRDNSERKYRYGALFGRINLNWKQRFYINLTGRRDGSSRFGPGKQFANFGAVGAAWIFSDEPFLKNILSVLSFGKLRGSFGITGSDNIGDYKYLDTYSSSGINYQGIIGLEPSGLFNPDFAWESNRKLEAAIELWFINERIRLNVGYYNNRSSNQLVGIPLSDVTGFSSIQANLAATVQNTGWEMALNTVNIRKSRFFWETSVNLTIPRNKLVAFPGLENSTYASQYIVGEPLNIVKLYHYQGVDPETGVYQLEDVNNDGLMSIDDRTSVGRLYQDFYGGLNNSLSVGNFRLDIFFQFVKQAGRNYLYSFPRQGLMQNQPKEVMQRWQHEGDDSDVQRFTAGGNQEAVLASSRLYISDAAYSDASFIRLKNLTIGYNLPGLFDGVKGRIFCQGQNLLTITNYQGVDPESNGTSNMALPPLRMVTTGIELTF